MSVLDAIEANAERFRGVRVHQMHALHDRPYLHGTMRDHLLHVSYFLSPVTRPAFHERGCELVPNHFSEVPRLLRETTKCSMVLAAAAPMDRHGYFSLGTNCDYVAPFIGTVPFFLEVNARMPRTFGRNQHPRQPGRGLDRGRPTAGGDPAVRRRPTSTSASPRYVAERIPDGATIQAGIGSIPNALLARSARPPRPRRAHRAALRRAHRPHRARGRHRHPQAAGTRARSSRPSRSAPSSSTTSSHENPAVEFLPVDYVNDPRVIAQEDCFVSINATTEVDLVGQCASETVGGRYWSSSGGQADFARGAMYSPHGMAFVVLPSTAAERRGLADPGDAHPRIDGHHAQEHRRPRRHRVRRRRHARPLDLASARRRSSASPIRGSATSSQPKREAFDYL